LPGRGQGRGLGYNAQTLTPVLRSVVRRATPADVRHQWRRLRRGWEKSLARWQLARLRGRMFAVPPRTTGEETLFGYTVRITDAPNFYIQYKDEFIQRIYHFESPRPDPLIIDGGSNMGLSILAFKRAYPRARIIGFEPDPAILRLLQDNLRRNELGEGITLVNAGLGGEAGQMSFVPDGTAGGRIETVGDAKGSFRVRVDRLSDYLDEPVDFLKLNIEGQELPVLQEAAASGKLGNVRQMVLEYHGFPDAPQQLGPILDLLDRNGFRYMVHDFDSETNPATKPPFHLAPQTTWFCLVYARQLEAGA